jgi:hypothetical protein
MHEDGVSMRLNSYVKKISTVINLPIGCPLFVPYLNETGFIKDITYTKEITYLYREAEPGDYITRFDYSDLIIGVKF